MEIPGGFTLVWRSITRRKARSLLTISGTAMGIAAIVLLSSIMAGLETQMISVLGRGNADLLVVQKGSYDFALSKLSEGQAQRLTQIPGVTHVSPVLVVVTELEGYPFFIVNGLRVDGFTIDHFKVVEGNGLAEHDRGKILLGKKISLLLKKGIHDKITLIGDEYEIVGIYETGIKFEDYGAVLPLDELQETFDHAGLVSVIEVRVEDVTRIDEVKTIIAREIPDVDADVPTEVASRQEDVQMLKGVVSIVSLVAIFLGSVIMMNTMIMSVYERTREIGVLRALGWRRKSVLLLILKETILLALMGGALGLLVALLGIQAMESFVSAPVPAVLDLGNICWGIACAVFLGLLGGIYPAVRATKMDPVEALGHEV